MQLSSKTFWLAGVATLGMVLVTGSTTFAQHYGHNHGGYGGGYGNVYRGGYGGFRAPVYHPPSVHTDYRYHPTQVHWTPLRGLHTHGHYDAVPHYTPGHYDTYHNGHIHGNPYYHHR